VKIAVVFGTRPEAIKMAPVIHAARRMADPVIISSGQHRDMIAPILDWFQIKPDHDLALMKAGQTPQDLLARALLALNDVLENTRPDAVLVQGDTSTALAGALAAFHLKIPVGHVEAGLRTGDIHSPFPEEANRQLISRIAAWHFAPTLRQAEFLHAEKVSGMVSVVGNTVVDALEWTSMRLGEPKTPERPFVVVTAHRRESFGAPIREAFAAIGELARRHPGFDFIYPVHRNPNVLGPASEILGKIANVKLIDPLEYPELIDLLRRSHLVISDSGGIQEEAPSFGVPVLILRESTERPEVIDAGIGHLVGTSRERILKMGSHFLDNPQSRFEASSAANPFGDGRAGEKIIAQLLAAGASVSKPQ
jgi:UDP-N-acetylglucosamine 2-epimerase (non-hydrolysing)